MPPAAVKRLRLLILALLVGHCALCARPYDPEDERLPGWQVGSQAPLCWLQATYYAVEATAVVSHSPAA